VREAQALVLGAQVLAQAVPVEARKQSRATLPLSQAAERPLQGVWSREVVWGAETVAALEVVQAVEPEEAQV